MRRRTARLHTNGCAPGQYQLTFGPHHATVGQPCTLHFEPAYLGDETADGAPRVTDAQFVFDVQSVSGSVLVVDGAVATITAEAGDAGDHHIIVRMRERGCLVDRADFTLHVREPVADLGKVLTCGDSISAAGMWQASLGLPATPIGTQHAYGVDHEAHAGKTFAWYATDAASPMVNGGIDVPGYTGALGHVPDAVVWLLLTNSVFTTEVPATTIGTELSHAEDLIDAWQTAHPTAKHVVCLPAPGNSRESAFVSNYDGDLEDLYRWEIRHRLACQSAIDAFGSREGEGIYLCSVATALDRTDGYPVDNALHPSLSGHQQIAARITAALNYAVGG